MTVGRGAIDSGVERSVVLVARGFGVAVARSLVAIVGVGSIDTVRVARAVGVTSPPCCDPLSGVESMGTDVDPGVGPTTAVEVESAGTGDASKDSCVAVEPGEVVPVSPVNTLSSGPAVEVASSLPDSLVDD